MSMALNWRLGAAVALHSCLATTSFYVFTILTSMEPFVKNLTISSIDSHYGHELKEYEWSWAWGIINSSLLFGCFLGSPLLKVITDTFGRRNSVMLLRNIVLMVATVMQLAARPLNAIELLVLGRFLVGLSQCLTLYVPVFVGECAPTHQRGLASMFVGVGYRSFTVLGPVCALPGLFGSEEYWHFALLVPFFPTFLHLLCAPFLPKSPKYLFIVEQNKEESRKAIEFYHGKGADVEQVFADYAKEAVLSKSTTTTNLCEILRTRHLRWPFVLCLAVHMIRPFGGLFIVHHYSTGLIHSFGISQTQAALFTVVALQLPSFFTTFLSTLLVERFGRRPLLLFGHGMMITGVTLLFVSNLTSGLSSTFAVTLSIGGMCLILNGNAFGPLMIQIMMPSEICPQSVRSYTAAASMTTNWFLIVIIVFAFPPLSAAIGSFALLPLILLCGTIWVFLWFKLPETKGKTVEATVRRWINCDAIEL